jgi:hypothetical protein
VACHASLNGSDIDEHTLSSVFSDASHVVAERFIAGDASDVPKIFPYVESVLESGTQEEQDAAATCFLENLMNRTPTKIEPKLWIPSLGPKSRLFCRAWDEFTGIRTQYLHDNTEG